MRLKLIILSGAMLLALGAGLLKTDTELPPIKDSLNNDAVLHEVPFVSQAPLGDWKDRRQAYGCEETAALMAIRWARGESLSAEEALEEIIASSEFQLEKYGYYEDTSAADTVERIIKEYFEFENAELAYDIGINEIKNALKGGRVVLAPINGTAINNPYYEVPYHMILIIGYDDNKKEFIVNDPGTRHGEKIRYSYETLSSALSDYTSGNGKGELVKRSAMIAVGGVSPEAR